MTPLLRGPNYSSQAALCLSSHAPLLPRACVEHSKRPRPSKPADACQLRRPGFSATPRAGSTLLIRFRPVTHFHFAGRAVDSLKSRARIWLGPRGTCAKHGLLSSLLHGTELRIAAQADPLPERAGSPREGAVTLRVRAEE